VAEPRPQHVRWAEQEAGRRVVEVERLTGGMTSTMLRLQHDHGADSVLRLITEEPWRTHGAELATREAETLEVLAFADVPAPHTLALDAHGAQTGHAAHLMTFVPGSLSHDLVDDGSLAEVARLLARIHLVRAEPPPRTFQSWAWEAKWVVPPWSSSPDLWRRAFDVLRAGDPPYDACFLHRDFGLHNLLWTGRRVTGIVDWVETSTGPAWLDVAHCATNLAWRHGPDVADRFQAAYVAETGRRPDRYWDVLDIVGFLPPPGGSPFFTRPRSWRRFDAHLARVLDDLG
jgi:aminoglycoside phosphotransferase (APT) family kinase protein